MTRIAHREVTWPCCIAMTRTGAAAGRRFRGAMICRPDTNFYYTWCNKKRVLSQCEPILTKLTNLILIKVLYLPYQYYDYYENSFLKSDLSWNPSIDTCITSGVKSRRRTSQSPLELKKHTRNLYDRNLHFMRTNFGYLLSPEYFQPENDLHHVLDFFHVRVRNYQGFQ